MVNGIVSADLPKSTENDLVRVRETLSELHRLMRRLEPENLSDLVSELDELAESVKDMRDQAKAISTVYRTGAQTQFGCWVAKMVGRYGPYLYHITTNHGRQTWTYHGKVGSERARAARNGTYQMSEDERFGKSATATEVEE